MKKLYQLILFSGILIAMLSFTSADSQSFSMNFNIPADDTSPPVLNLENYTHNIYTPFSEVIGATDETGISCFTLNDTSVFNIDCSGTMVNITALDSLTTYWLNVTVNDTLGYESSGVFYVQIRTPTGTTTVATPMCRYKKLMYYNPDLAWMKEVNCI